MTLFSDLTQGVGHSGREPQWGRQMGLWLSKRLPCHKGSPHSPASLQEETWFVLPALALANHVTSGKSLNLPRLPLHSEGFPVSSPTFSGTWQGSHLAGLLPETGLVQLPGISLCELRTFYFLCPTLMSISKHTSQAEKSDKESNFSVLLALTSPHEPNGTSDTRPSPVMKWKVGRPRQMPSFART